MGNGRWRFDFRNTQVFPSTGEEPYERGRSFRLLGSKKVVLSPFVFGQHFQVFWDLLLF